MSELPSVQLRRAVAEMNRLLGETERLGEELAQREYQYRLAAAKKILQLRDAKTSVTLIPALMKGDEEVAAIILERDLAEVRYKVAQERIQAAKKEIAVYSDEVNREWGQAKYE